MAVILYTLLALAPFFPADTVRADERFSAPTSVSSDVEVQVAENGAAAVLSLRQGALVGAGIGCAAVGALIARDAPADTRGVAFITGCALGAPVGAIAGIFAALGAI